MLVLIVTDRKNSGKLRKTLNLARLSSPQQITTKSELPSLLFIPHDPPEEELSF